MGDKAVLAYSGGLDTSVTIRWLAERGYEVHAVAVDVGQQEDFEGVIERGRRAGAASVRVIDAVQRYAAEYLTKAIKANAMYEGKYPMVSGLARPCIAEEVIAVARAVGASTVAHGCTGKGNDQVRFELTYSGTGATLDSHRSLARVAHPLPGRRHRLRGRARCAGAGTAAKIYSLDGNLWHLSHEGGALEDPWTEPPEDAYSLTVSPSSPPDDPRLPHAWFRRGMAGQPRWSAPGTTGARAGAQRHRWGAWSRPHRSAGEPAGRDEEPRCLRDSWRHCSSTTAHRELEHLTLDKATMRLKDELALTYADLVYNGLWFSPLRQALDAFVDQSQLPVTGDVRLRYEPGICTVVGRRSEHSLYDLSSATYGSDDAFDQSDGSGVCRVVRAPAQSVVREAAAGNVSEGSGPLWAGRFSTQPAPEAEALGRSLEVDERLAFEDAQAGIAHVAALRDVGLVTAEEQERLDEVLESEVRDERSCVARSRSSRTTRTSTRRSNAG